MKRYIRGSASGTMVAYCVSRSAMSKYYKISTGTYLGTYCRSKLAAYVTAVSTPSDSFIDKLTLQPTRLLESTCVITNNPTPNIVDCFNIDEAARDRLKDAMYGADDSGYALRDALLAEGYDCIKCRDNINGVNDYSYIVLDSSVIVDVENNELITFRALFPDRIRHVDIRDLSPTDMVCMTNGMYDVCIAKFVSYDYEYDGSYRQYEIEGRIIQNLAFSAPKFKAGFVTNMYTYSKDIEVITSIPEVLRG